MYLSEIIIKKDHLQNIVIGNYGRILAKSRCLICRPTTYYSIISQFTVAVWAWADKGHCRTNCEIHGDEILDTCSWKLCNHYSFMHSMIHRWKYSLKRGNKGYLCSTSIDVGVMISKCTKWDLFMFLRSVDIRGHCSNVLTVNWSIILRMAAILNILLCLLEMSPFWIIRKTDTFIFKEINVFISVLKSSGLGTEGSRIRIQVKALVPFGKALTSITKSTEEDLKPSVNFSYFQEYASFLSSQVKQFSSSWSSSMWRSFYLVNTRLFECLWELTWLMKMKIGNNLISIIPP